MIFEDQINKFKQDGYIVISNVLNENEIGYFRNCFHNELNAIGYNYNQIISYGNYFGVNFANKREDLANSFYYYWKMELQASDKIYQIYKKLILETKDMYDIKECTDVLPFIDRMGLRFPDHIYAEGGLNLHLDKLGVKFRPIQGFLSLTDQTTNKHGGLQLVKGFHNQNNSHSQTIQMNLKSNQYLMDSLTDIKVKAGSLVLWDYRLPHKTNGKFTSNDTREVIYMSYIPNTKQNKEYLQAQWNNFLNSIPPPDFPHDKANCVFNYEYPKELSQQATKRYSGKSQKNFKFDIKKYHLIISNDSSENS